MRLRLCILRVYRVRYLYVTKQKKKLSGGEIEGRPRVSKRKDRRKRTKLKNSNQVIDISLFFSFSRSLFETNGVFRLLFPSQFFFFQARESSDNENLNAFHGYYHWLWSHCGLDRSRSSMPVLPFVELSMIADRSRFCQKCACTFKIENR